MPNTTNYNWATPADSDLVKDGALAIRTLGTAIDTTTKNLNPETTLGDLAYRSSTANVNTRLALGTANQQLRVNSGATAPEWFTPTAAGGMTLISTLTANNDSSLTFSSIPSTYNNLQLIVQNYRPASETDLVIRFNGDSGANRYAFQPNSTGNVYSDSALSFDTTRGIIMFANDDTTSSSSGMVNIYDYTNTTTWKFAHAIGISTHKTTTTQFTYCNLVTIYNQTAAISSVTVLANSGNITAGTFSLYGVK